MQLSHDDIYKLAAYARHKLKMDKLYYLLKTLAKHHDYEVRETLLADICGDFVQISKLKRYYRDYFSEEIDPIAFNMRNAQHIWSYFLFVKETFELAGYNGWVVLFDEAELIGHLSQNARFRAYTNIAQFLHTKDIFSIFAFNSSYVHDVIEGQNEYGELKEAENFGVEKIEKILNSIEKTPELLSLEQEELVTILAKEVSCGTQPIERVLIEIELNPELLTFERNELVGILGKANEFDAEAIKQVLNQISVTPELTPLNKNERINVMEKILIYHAKAYDWIPHINSSELFDIVRFNGFLLRSTIRAAIDHLDVLYQYKD